MKLETSIKPRRDGVVLTTGLDGSKYTFAPDPEHGDALVCEVGDEATVKHLLALGNFYPANEADFDRAAELVGDTDGDGEGDGDGEDDPVDPNALPIESNTPPVPGPPKKIKRKAD